MEGGIELHTELCREVGVQEVLARKIGGRCPWILVEEEDGVDLLGMSFRGKFLAGKLECGQGKR